MTYAYKILIITDFLGNVQSPGQNTTTEKLIHLIDAVFFD